MWRKAFRDWIEHALGPDPADDEIATFLTSSFASKEIPSSMAEINEVLMPDKIFHSVTHAILLPLEIMELLKELKQTESLKPTKVSKSGFREAAELFKSHVHKTWKVNPVMFDPDWYRYIDGVAHAPDRSNRIKDWVRHFYETIAQELFLDPPLEKLERLLLGTHFGTQVGRFYWNLGEGLNDLCGHIRLEVAVGDIVAFTTTVKSSAKEREMRGFPNSLLNIPDYTGLLLSFVGCLPLLDQTSQSILRHNVLLNTGIWGNFDEYVLSTVYRTFGDLVTRLLKAI